MNRSARQAKILDIIANNAIDTQEELADRLREAGYNVTQATISRDIKELNLVKTLYKGNSYKYVAMDNADSLVSDKLISIFVQTVLSVTVCFNMVIVKTMQNTAMTVASIIEKMAIPQILAIIPAIDALVIVADNEQQAHTVAQNLQNLQN